MLPKILSGGVLKVESISSKYAILPNYFTAIFNFYKLSSLTSKVGKQEK
jgi:hypothetical protein